MRNEVNIRVKKLNDNAIVPTQGSEYAAGYDLYASFQEIFNPTIIAPGETMMIGTGLAVELPEGYAGLIYARSGLAVKLGLRPANCVGVVDSDYRGEVMVALHNDSPLVQEVHNGDRIAQMIITPYLNVTFCETEELSDTERGSGGFGHTGK